jgi:hypothetical protein
MCFIKNHAKLVGFLERVLSYNTPATDYNTPTVLATDPLEQLSFYLDTPCADTPYVDGAASIAKALVGALKIFQDSKFDLLQFTSL